MASKGYASYNADSLGEFAGALGVLANGLIESAETLATLCSKLDSSEEVQQSEGLRSFSEVLGKIQAETVNNDDSMKARLTAMVSNLKKQLEQLDLVFNVNAKKKTEEAVETLASSVKKIKESTTSKK